MTQMYTYDFTSAASPVAVDINIGFDAAEVRLMNLTGMSSTANPGVVKRAEWNDQMDNGYACLVKNTAGAATDESSIITSNGISMIDDGAVYGATISGFTNANPGVITASGIAQCGIVAGDTIKVTELADDETGSGSLNGTYVVASVTSTTITLTTTTVGKAVYVSGGKVIRVTNSSGTPIATQNYGQRKVRIGTGCQAASSEITVVILGKNSVV